MWEREPSGLPIQAGFWLEWGIDTVLPEARVLNRAQLTGNSTAHNRAPPGTLELLHEVSTRPPPRSSLFPRETSSTSRPGYRGSHPTG